MQPQLINAAAGAEDQQRHVIRCQPANQPACCSCSSAIQVRIAVVRFNRISRLYASNQSSGESPYHYILRRWHRQNTIQVQRHMIARKRCCSVQKRIAVLLSQLGPSASYTQERASLQYNTSLYASWQHIANAVVHPPRIVLCLSAITPGASKWPAVALYIGLHMKVGSFYGGVIQQGYMNRKQNNL